jgi:hypothetical protein
VVATEGSGYSCSGPSYIRCYPNIKDWTSHQSWSMEWNTSPNSTMSCIRFPTTSRWHYHLRLAIDCGANGGVAGSDTWLIDKSLHSVHIQGINDHMIKESALSVQS